MVSSKTGKSEVIDTSKKTRIVLFNSFLSELEEKFGLRTIGDALAVLALARHGSMGATDLAREARLVSGNGTGLIDRLESCGIVTRLANEGAEDRRRRTVALSPRGEALVQQWGTDQYE